MKSKQWQQKTTEQKDNEKTKENIDKKKREEIEGVFGSMLPT